MFKCTGDLVGFVDPFGVIPEFCDGSGHIDLVGAHDFVCVRIVAFTPETWAVTGESSVADVDNGNGKVLTDGHFEVSHHIT